MLFNIEFWSKEQYLPTKRHRLLRERYVKSDIDVDIKELSEKEFPLAFIIHDYQNVYKNAKSYEDFDGNGEYRMFSEEIRTYDGKLFKPVRITHGSAISINFESFDYIKWSLQDRAPYWKGGEDFTEKSIVKGNTRDECKQAILSKAKKYLVFDNKVWEICGEPMYQISTFGLGHNHGGTGFFITYSYNSNIRSKNYFNALKREEAIAYGKQIALNRGDTDSVERMGEYDIIEVLMPEMVKRNPEQEHGDGDPFINSLESMIEKTESSAEAACFAMFMALK